MAERMIEMLMMLVAQAKKAPEGQQEYGLAWALVAGFLFLGLLVTSVPRPKAHDLPENEKKRQRELAMGIKRSGKPGGGKAAAPASFSAAISARRDQK